MTTQNGKKFDEHKPRWDLLPVYPIEEAVKVFTFGAKKYGDNNWRKIENPHDRYYAALMRHIIPWRKGEIIDPESGLPHLAHAIANLVILMEYYRMLDKAEELTDLMSKEKQINDKGERGFGITKEQVILY